MCRTRKWNLLYECLTGFEAREALRNMKATNPEFWKELTTGATSEASDDDMGVEEDPDVGVEQFDDDSNLPSDVVVAHVLKQDSPINTLLNADGDLMSAAQA